MKDYFYVSPSVMLELSRSLLGSEIKMLYAVMYCMSKAGSKLFINNAANRARMSEVGFSKTPERVCALLSSLVKKGVLVREANSLYSMREDLFLLPDEIEK